MEKNYDQKIIKAISLHNDVVAEKELYSKIYPYIKKLAFKYEYSEADAEDLFQDCIVILIGKIQYDLKLSCSLATYMYSIAEKLIYKKHYLDEKIEKAIQVAAYESHESNNSEVVNPVEKQEVEDNEGKKKELLQKHLDAMNEEKKQIIMSSDKNTRKERWNYKQQLRKSIEDDPDFDSLDD